MSIVGTRAGVGQRRYRAANSTRTSYIVDVATPMRIAAPTANGNVLCINGNASVPIWGADGPFKGLRLTPFGTGANNTTFQYRFYLGWNVLRSDGTVDHVQVSPMLTGTATLSSSLTPPSGSTVFQTGDVRADLVTVTGTSVTTSPKGLYDTYFNASGAANDVQAFAPNDNLNDAQIVIPDLYDADFWFIDDITGGSATGMNWLVERWNPRAGA
jgi:hypothetical protein